MEPTRSPTKLTYLSNPAKTLTRFGFLRTRRDVGTFQENENSTHTVNLQHSVHYGETASARTIYTVVAMICLLVLGAMLVVEIGLGLATASICNAAVYVCLVFYMLSKAFMYIFLIERIYILRSPYSSRTRDGLWLSGMLSLGLGFGTIAVIAFIWPMAELSDEDGKCRIGLPLKVSIPLLTFDVVFNVALTGVFIYLIRPLLSFGSNSDAASSWTTRLISRISWALGIKKTDDEFNRNRKRIKSLLWKSLIGASLILFPTMANLSVLYAFEGRELGWLCFTVCTLDITWGVCIVHWLTMDQLEEPLKQGISLPDSSSRSTSLAACCDYTFNNGGSREFQSQVG